MVKKEISSNNNKYVTLSLPGNLCWSAGKNEAKSGACQAGLRSICRNQSRMIEELS